MSADPPSEPASPPSRRRPWWIPPFLGPVPAVEGRHLDLLGAVALALLFEEYDLAMLTAALPQIAAELDMAETDFGFYLGMIRMGALPAFALIPYADRIGRKRVFLWTLMGTAVATLLTLVVIPVVYSLWQQWVAVQAAPTVSLEAAPAGAD